MSFVENATGRMLALTALPSSIILNVIELVTKENINWGFTIILSVIATFSGIALLKYYLLINKKKKIDIENSKLEQEERKLNIDICKQKLHKK